MSAAAAFLSSYAPFLTATWPYLLAVGTLFAGFVIARVLSFGKVDTGSPSSEKPPKRSIQIREKGEHPMAEFDTDAGEAEEENPSLHSEDTAHVVYPFERLRTQEMVKRAEEFYVMMNKRRSVREFSPDPVPIEVINNIIKTAGTSPSGAHTEPWTFVAIRDKEIKVKIREIVEQEEYLNYDHRMGDKWVKDLKFVGTTHDKSYLETAPYIIIVFKQPYHVDEKGIRHSHYYFEISTAMACGILVTAIHNAGLVTVTTTPLNAGKTLAFAWQEGQSRV